MEKMVKKNKLITEDKIGLIVVIGFISGVISLVIYNSIMLGIN